MRTKLILLSTLIPAALAQRAASKKYIVSFANGSRSNEEVEELEREVSRRSRGKRARGKVSNAVAFENLEDDEVDEISKIPGVIVEEDIEVHSFAPVAQSSATWGLDRIDQASLPLDTKYNYGSTAGAGVNVYVIDTGIKTSHSEFEGRASQRYNSIGDGKEDCAGHGTHVASTIGGKTVGVAKKANLIGVKVLDCSGGGTASTVLSGIQWVIDTHKASSNKKSIINMSLGGGKSSAIDNLVATATSAGILVVAAAGNEAQSACNVSPGGAPSAITVAASDSSDRHASFSNYGSCVDLYAPGVSIKGAAYSSTTGFTTMSGTSMASPHVAGVAALYWGYGSYTPSSLTTKILSKATTGKILSIKTGTPNKLLFQDTKVDGR